MLARLRPRSVYDVLAAIGCFVALSTGGAYASHLVVDSSDVVDEALSGVDVQGKPRTNTTAAVNGSLTTDDIAGQQAHGATGTPFIDGTLTQWDIKNNAVTGSDVLESSLAKVPDADKLDGLDSGQLSPVSGDGRTADLALTINVDQTVLSANITTARSAALLVTAAVNVRQPQAAFNVFAICSLRFDNSTSSPEYSTQFDNTETLPLVWAQSVGPGTHTVELRCRNAGGQITVDDAGLIVSAHV